MQHPMYSILLVDVDLQLEQFTRRDQNKREKQTTTKRDTLEES